MDPILDLIRPEHRPARVALRDGYVDLLGEDDPTGGGPGQRLMVSRLLPYIYERLWRPLGGGCSWARRAGHAGRARIALEMLAIAPAGAVLDVACGPGNFTRAFAAPAGSRDWSSGSTPRGTMLGRRSSSARANISYVRGGATTSPSGTAPSTRSAASPRCT